MSKRRHTAEKIIGKLREADVQLALSDFLERLSPKRFGPSWEWARPKLLQP